ncbi:hypothetical protein LJR220_005855 [Bradyrhizobium sp. LjRoot220]
MLYKHDEHDKHFLNGLKQGLGAKASMIVVDASYELSVRTIDSRPFS